MPDDLSCLLVWFAQSHLSKSRAPTNPHIDALVTKVGQLGEWAWGLYFIAALYTAVTSAVGFARLFLSVYNFFRHPPSNHIRCPNGNLKHPDGD